MMALPPHQPVERRGLFRHDHRIEQRQQQQPRPEHHAPPPQWQAAPAGMAWNICNGLDTKCWPTISEARPLALAARVCSIRLAVSGP